MAPCENHGLVSEGIANSNPRVPHIWILIGNI